MHRPTHVMMLPLPDRLARPWRSLAQHSRRLLQDELHGALPAGGTCTKPLWARACVLASKRSSSFRSSSGRLGEGSLGACAGTSCQPALAGRSWCADMCWRRAAAWPIHKSVCRRGRQLAPQPAPTRSHPQAAQPCTHRVRLRAGRGAHLLPKHVKFCADKAVPQAPRARPRRQVRLAVRCGAFRCCLRS